MKRKSESIQESSISELLNEIRMDRSHAFDRLTESYQPLLVSMVDSACERYRDYRPEREDLYQEALLALYRAAMTYDCDQQAVTFGLYAKVCIRNRLVSYGRRLAKQGRAVKASESARKSEVEIGVKVGSREPSEWVLELLSPYEKEVYRLYVEGKSYALIAERLGHEEKSIENAIYRIRRKIRSGPKVHNMPE